MQAIKIEQHSIAAYFDLLEQSDERLEYHNGEVVMMAGGTRNHSSIGNNINGEIRAALKGRSDCRPFNNDLKVYIEKTNSFVFPDGMVVCGETKLYKNSESVITNPKLVIEVLSKSTQGYDRGDKFHKYCSLDSFCEYILIDQYQPVIDTLFRAEKGLWQMRTTIGLEQSIYLHSIDATIELEDIYRNTVGLAEPQFRLDV